MMTIANPRRRAGQRVSSAVWGLLVAGAGGLMIAAFSGYEIDLELAAIIVLGAVGAWLLLSAAVSGIGRKREVARATAPTVEERVVPPSAPSDRATDNVDTAATTDSEAAGDADDLTPEEPSGQRDRES